MTLHSWRQGLVKVIYSKIKLKLAAQPKFYLLLLTSLFQV